MSTETVNKGNSGYRELKQNRKRFLAGAAGRSEIIPDKTERLARGYNG